MIVDPPLSRYPRRIRKSTQLSNFVYSYFLPSFTSFLLSLHNPSKPTSYREAVLDPKWQQTMVEELDTLNCRTIWDLVPLLLGKSTIGSRWVYKSQTKSYR